MTDNRNYRTQQYAARADVDAEGLLKVTINLENVSAPNSMDGHVSCISDVLWDACKVCVVVSGCVHIKKTFRSLLEPFIFQY